MRIELPNDITPHVEIDYGGMQINHRLYINNVVRYVICLHCNYENKTQGGIKTHHARRRNALQLHYNPKWPYCPKHVEIPVR